MERAYDPQSFDHLVEGYDFMASLGRKPEFFLERLPEQRRRALDVGCGSGILAIELSRHFGSVLAIDVSKPMLELAARKRSAPNLEYRLTDVDDLRVDGTFDAIVSHTALHHVPDLPATLKRLKSLLAPGGRIIVVDIVKGWLPMRPTVWVLSALLDVPIHIRRFGARSARRIFRFRTSKPWMDHLRTDVFLRPDEFRTIYERELPGCEFEPVGPFMSAVWQA